MELLSIYIGNKSLALVKKLSHLSIAVLQRVSMITMFWNTISPLYATLLFFLKLVISIRTQKLLNQYYLILKKIKDNTVYWSSVNFQSFFLFKKYFKKNAKKKKKGFFWGGTFWIFNFLI